MDKDSKNDQFRLAEYGALREEIIKRIELEYQFINLSLAIFGILCGVGLQSHSGLIVLLYPLLCIWLTLAWVNSDTSILYIAQYIKNEIEANFGENNVGWEHYFENQKKHASSTFSVLGVFVGTSVASIVIGPILSSFNFTEAAFLFIAVLCSVFSTFLVIRYSFKRRKSIHIPIQNSKKIPENKPTIQSTSGD